jgi:PleD family two-component response regulator
LSVDVAGAELRLLHRLPEAQLRWAAILAGGLLWAVFAAMLGLVMFSVRLNGALSKVRFLMNQDTLTNLLNRRGFAAARRDGRRTALLLMDIDHFKRVNDSHGHDAGDQVLAGIAQRLSVGVMEYDLVCRWGWDEPLERAVDRADNLMYEAKAAGRNQIKSDIAGAS